MAGRVVVSTLNDDAGVLATQNGMTGICKAWLYYNAVTTTIIRSFNVSSVVVNSTGRYTVNFTTAMPNTTYSVVACGAGTIPASESSAPCFSVAPSTASACTFASYQSQAVTNATQLAVNMVAVFSS
jgi:hypothetical protein